MSRDCNKPPVTTSKKSAPSSPVLVSPPQEWKETQARIRSQILEHDDVNFIIDSSVKYIGGVDVSFVQGTNQAMAALIVMEFPSFQIVHEDFRVVQMEAPYIAGYLAFREVDHLLVLIDALRTSPTKSMYLPQIIMVDGNGVLHPQRCGLASHLGVMCGIPTIGIGKNLHHLPDDGVDKSLINSWREENERKDLNYLKKVRTLILQGSNSGVVHGAALCVHGVKKPIFVSVGHRLSLETCLALTIRCSEYRIPRPVRAADLRSRELLRVMEEETVGVTVATSSGERKEGGASQHGEH